MGSYKRVISKVTIVITHIRGLIPPLITTLNPKLPNPYRSLKGTPLKNLITPLITTHEPPSTGLGFKV